MAVQQPSSEEPRPNITDIYIDPGSLPKPEPDLRTQAADSLYLQEQVADLKSNRKLREKYAKRCFRFMSLWSIVVLILILMDGFSTKDFNISDTVMTVIVGSTTATVIGMVTVINKGLFNIKQSDK